MQSPNEKASLPQQPSRGQGSDQARRDSRPLPGLLARGGFGGILMGMANLVPGVSGGTMLLAAGVYRDFVEAIADLTRLRIRLRPLLVLGAIGGAAAVAILLGAGLLKDLVVEHRWVMYSLFVGLTLGGVPLVWRPVKNKSAAYWIGATIGLTGMVMLSLAQTSTPASSSNSGFFPLLGAGAVGASAMILPGISGGYLLLLMGQYLPILSGLDRLKSALIAGNTPAAIDAIQHVVLPVGFGVVLGIVLVANLVQWFFRRFEAGTYGLLLGLLLGATFGLWPFQEPVAPIPGVTVIKGQVVSSETLELIALEDYPTQVFTPGAIQVFGALLLVALGVAITWIVARLGRERPRPGRPAQSLPGG